MLLPPYYFFFLTAPPQAALASRELRNDASIFAPGRGAASTGGSRGAPCSWFACGSIARAMERGRPKAGQDLTGPIDMSSGEWRRRSNLCRILRMHDCLVAPLRIGSWPPSMLQSRRALRSTTAAAHPARSCWLLGIQPPARRQYAPAALSWRSMARGTLLPLRDDRAFHLLFLAVDIQDLTYNDSGRRWK